MFQHSVPRTGIHPARLQYAGADPSVWSANHAERNEPPWLEQTEKRVASLGPIRPRLMCFGDPHGSFEFVIRSVQTQRPEAIILLGDIQARRPLQVELAPILALTEVWFIPGNHDTDSDVDYDHLFGSELAHRNLHGRVVEIAGFRVAGLGGVFRESIWAPPFDPAFASRLDRLRVVRETERWRGGVSRRHRSSIFPDEYASLARKRADVLVTHEGLGGHPHGWKALDDLALAMRVEVVVHGHLHENIDYVADGSLDPGAGYQAFGVAPQHYLLWPGCDSSRAGSST